MDTVRKLIAPVLVPTILAQMKMAWTVQLRRIESVLKAKQAKAAIAWRDMSQ